MPRYDSSFSCAARSSALKNSTPKPETGNTVDLPLPGGTGNDTHPWRHLPAEVAVRAFLHILREVRANAIALRIDDPKLF
jgi:hypothetical protein